MELRPVGRQLRLPHSRNLFFPGENARSWEALGEARPGQSSLSAGALRYRAWAQSWSSAAVEAHSVHPNTACKLPQPACLFSPTSGNWASRPGHKALPGALCSGAGSPVLVL